MKSILAILLFSLLIYSQEADTVEIDTTSSDTVAESKETELIEKEKKKSDESRDQWAYNPWKRMVFRGGGYISNVNTSLGFKKNDGGGAKIVVDSEDMFNLEATNSVWRGMLSGRINHRHTIDFDIFNLNRTAKNFIGLEIPLGKSDSLKVGELVETTYELFFTKLTYNFSFYQNEKVDLAAGLGLHLLSTGLKFVSDENTIGGDSRLNLPLPVLSSRFSFAPREWLHFLMTTSYLYVEFDAFEGSLLESSLLCDIRIWKYVGAGLGYSSIRFDGGAVTGDLFSEMNVGFNGLVFYLSAYF